MTGSTTVTRAQLPRRAARLRLDADVAPACAAAEGPAVAASEEDVVELEDRFDPAPVKSPVNLAILRRILTDDGRREPEVASTKTRAAVLDAAELVLSRRMAIACHIAPLLVGSAASSPDGALVAANGLIRDHEMLARLFRSGELGVGEAVEALEPFRVCPPSGASGSRPHSGDVGLCSLGATDTLMGTSGAVRYRSKDGRTTAAVDGAKVEAITGEKTGEEAAMGSIPVRMSPVATEARRELW